MVAGLLPAYRLIVVTEDQENWLLIISSDIKQR